MAVLPVLPPKYCPGVAEKVAPAPEVLVAFETASLETLLITRFKAARREGEMLFEEI